MRVRRPLICDGVYISNYLLLLEVADDLAIVDYLDDDCPEDYEGNH